MAFSITSTADAQEIVNTLRADPSNLILRINVAKSLTDPNWNMMVQAGYVEFCTSEVESWKEGEIYNGGCPVWLPSSYEVGASLQKINEISGDQGEVDLRLLFKLRNLVLRKLVKPILSTVPGAGLQTLATLSQSSDQYSSMLGLECLNVGMIVVYTVVDSLVIYPDPAFLEEFCAAGAIEIAAICWNYCGDPYRRNMCTVALNQLVESTSFKDLAFQRLMRHLSAEGIVKKCKEILRDFMVPDQMGTFIQSNMIQLLVNMSGPPMGQLGRILSNESVPSVLVEVGRHAIKAKIVDWELIRMLPAPLIVLFHAAPNPSAIIIESIERCGILELIGLAFLDKSFVEVDGHDGWFDLLQTISHSTTCYEIGCPLLCSERCANAVARMLKQDSLWMKILVALRALTETKAEETYKVARKKRLAGWLELGRVVGLVDNGPSDQTAAQTSTSSRTEGIPRKDENGCWHGGCDRHGKTDEETEWMLLKCSGCKKARYCSKECQSKDWKVLHKIECRSMRP